MICDCDLGKDIKVDDLLRFILTSFSDPTKLKQTRKSNIGRSCENERRPMFVSKQEMNVLLMMLFSRRRTVLVNWNT